MDFLDHPKSLLVFFLYVAFRCRIFIEVIALVYNILVICCIQVEYMCEINIHLKNEIRYVTDLIACYMLAIPSKGEITSDIFLCLNCISTAPRQHDTLSSIPH